MLYLSDYTMFCSATRMNNAQLVSLISVCYICVVTEKPDTQRRIANTVKHIVNCYTARQT